MLAHIRLKRNVFVLNSRRLQRLAVSTSHQNTHTCLPAAEIWYVLLLIIVATCNAETYLLLYVFVGLLLWVTPATKSTKFGSRYLGEGLSKWDKILQVATGGLMYPSTQTDLWPRGFP